MAGRVRFKGGSNPPPPKKNWTNDQDWDSTLFALDPDWWRAEGPALGRELG